ncbi:hypothetical protein GCM10018779_32690 [Streptomyces griseocarneus]|nr:hypothetical protein GCM10018779_32690 [Streptomyces griseocarneus]
MDEDLVSLSQIARLAGVGRAAVANWRRHHVDFPPAVGGTEESPRFQLAAAEDWLRIHGKIFEAEPPPEPATLALEGGRTITLHFPRLSHSPYGQETFEKLGGFIDADAPVRWPRDDVQRADVPGHPPFPGGRRRCGHQLRRIPDAPAT